MKRRFAVGCLLAVVGCFGSVGCGDDGSSSADAGNGNDAAANADAGVAECIRDPRPADDTRKVVIAHPYDDAGMQAGGYEVYELTSAGALTTTGVTFEMERAFDGTISFTHDGKIGLSVQDDGTIGIFRLNGDGSVDVLHAAYDAGGVAGFYATGIVISRLGGMAYVLNGQWRENGGGIYALRIHCDDTVSYEGMVAPARLAYGMQLVPGSDQAVVISEDIMGSAANNGAHLLDWSGAPNLVASADIFGDDESIVAGTAITADGRFVLAGDNNSFSKIENRIAIGEIATGALTPKAVLSPIDDPVSIIASPDNDAVLVVSGFGDAFFELDYDPGDATTPFSLVGEMTYTGGAPQLPSGAVLINRGTLRGRVLVSENTGIRQVQFESGSITDLGATSTGTGLAAIVGAIGVQP